MSFSVVWGFAGVNADCGICKTLAMAAFVGCFWFPMTRFLTELFLLLALGGGGKSIWLFKEGAFLGAGTGAGATARGKGAVLDEGGAGKSAVLFQVGAGCLLYFLARLVAAVYLAGFFVPPPKAGKLSCVRFSARL